jgi:hypothetical protein
MAGVSLTLLPQEHKEINGFRIRELAVLYLEHLMDVGLQQRRLLCRHDIPFDVQ